MSSPFCQGVDFFVGFVFSYSSTAVHTEQSQFTPGESFVLARLGQVRPRDRQDQAELFLLIPRAALPCRALCIPAIKRAEASKPALPCPALV